MSNGMKPYLFKDQVLYSGSGFKCPINTERPGQRSLLQEDEALFSLMFEDGKPKYSNATVGARELKLAGHGSEEKKLRRFVKNFRRAHPLYPSSRKGIKQTVRIHARTHY